jgi:hypothetical protein
MFKRRKLDPAVEAQKRRYPGISTETAERWATEDAAFMRMASFALDNPGCSDVLRGCPDLTMLAMNSFPPDLR